MRPLLLGAQRLLPALAACIVWGCIVWAGLVSAAGPAHAQDSELDPNRFAIQGVDDSDYPTVAVTVSVPKSLAGTSLSKEPFTITEDGRDIQPYLGISEESPETTASTVVLAIDVSNSMARSGSIGPARDAADLFVSQLDRDTNVALMTFGEDVEVLTAPTTDHTAVRSSIAQADVPPGAESITALNEGVRQAANLASTGPGQGTVVLLSDGKNSGSNVSQDDAVEALRANGVRLWAVELSSRSDRAALEALAGDDGRVRSAQGAGDLAAIYDDLASNLLREYVLRYDSEASGDTAIGVTLDHASVFAQDQVTERIEGQPSKADGQPAVTAVDGRSFFVRVAFLGSTPAYALGLGTVAIGVGMLLLTMLLPRTLRPADRLRQTMYSDSTSDRLTSLARWTTEATDRRLRRGTMGTRLDAQLESAGLDVRPGEFVVIIGSSMVVLATIGFAAGGLVAGLVLGLAVPLGVRLWFGIRRDRRQAKFADQLTDVLQLIGGSLRAGYSLTQAIDSISRDADEPAVTEFRRIIIEHRLGRDLNEAMDKCAVRMSNDDFAWVVQAIGIHRDVGGDLARVLDNVIATIRERAHVQRQVRTLSAEGRMSARVLIALPLLVMLGLQFTTPDYLAPMLGSTLGVLLLIVAAAMLLIGVAVIRRMSRIEY